MVYPVGIAIDDLGNLYVSNRVSEYSGNVEVYSAGSKSPTRTITNGVTSPVGIAVDAHRTLYVTNVFENNVEEYRSGQSIPYQTITEDISSPSSATVNKDGYLYITNIGSYTVVEFAAGSTKASHRKISKDLQNPEDSAYSPPLLP
jgi:serine/threonine-protein kinase